MFVCRKCKQPLKYSHEENEYYPTCQCGYDLPPVYVLRNSVGIINDANNGIKEEDLPF